MSGGQADDGEHGSQRPRYRRPSMTETLLRNPDLVDARSLSRRLIHIPIVHGLADLGSLSADVRDLYIAQKGREAWSESRRVIAAFWRDLERKIKVLDLDCDKLRLYQDGLPLCGHEAEIVGDLAETGGMNYRILLFLMARGATLEGTESPQLLLKEYHLLKTEAEQRRNEIRGHPSAGAAAKALLQERDRFIARRIGTTLQPGETGMLFVGALHRVTNWLPPTIEIKTLDDVVPECRLEQAELLG